LCITIILTKILNFVKTVFTFDFWVLSAESLVSVAKAEKATAKAQRMPV
jgi:hypothetical protein